MAEPKPKPEPEPASPEPGRVKPSEPDDVDEWMKPDERLIIERRRW